jgi:hypothetical protein
MLIPNAKFLALPLVALAVIASLPAPRSEATQSMRTVVPATIIADCGQAGAAHCRLAAEQSNIFVR